MKLLSKLFDRPELYDISDWHKEVAQYHRTKHQELNKNKNEQRSIIE